MRGRNSLDGEEIKMRHEGGRKISRRERRRKRRSENVGRERRRGKGGSAYQVYQVNRNI